MSSKFSATVGDWVNRTKRGLEAVFQEAAQDFVKELNSEVTKQIYDAPISESGYRRTGFLRASLVASAEGMPPLKDAEDRDYGKDEHMGQIILVINDMDPGAVLYLGYTSAYAARMHFGYTGPDSLGRTYAQAPKPWVTLCTQRWQEIVNTAAQRVRKEYGL